LKYSLLNRGLPSGNPITNLFVMVVGILTIAASIVFGFFAFLIIGSIVLIMASVIGIRIWWFNRKMRRQAPPQSANKASRTGGVIEGEYQVVPDDPKTD
jgi:protein-S-isoprenylcysteine O-methyltransferase Ste14